ncbi:hypothetical protein NPIL_236181 [Nephila pilipes]|uniref:Uncharacterized protein n=1 Tax=Nephila pilipes TaxID=299642 RepID=A0A8X6NA50_NEPPI|nr:hypothetical protein NPIL_236181 [Nephila pilipes]
MQHLVKSAPPSLLVTCKPPACQIRVKNATTSPPATANKAIRISLQNITAVQRVMRAQDNSHVRMTPIAQALSNQKTHRNRVYVARKPPLKISAKEVRKFIYRQFEQEQVVKAKKEPFDEISAETVALKSAAEHPAQYVNPDQCVRMNDVECLPSRQPEIKHRSQAPGTR